MQSPAGVVPKVVVAADVESTVGSSALPLRYPLRRLRVDQIELSPSLSRRPTCAGQTYAVVGTGYMGASIGLALRRAGATVLGVDSDPAHLVRSLELGAIDRDTDLDSISGCTVVVVAVPTAHTVDTLLRVLERVDPSTVVVDVASVKVPVASVIEADNYVGTHPMRGSHLKGPDEAVAHLFDRAPWMICPTGHSGAVAIESACDFVRSAGARPILVDAHLHDDLVARGSHLVQVVASALAREVAGDRPEVSFEFTGGGFRDATRIARAPAEMWTEVVLANAEPLMTAVDALVERLATFRQDLATGDRGAIAAFFEEPASLLARFLPDPDQPRGYVQKT